MSKALEGSLTMPPSAYFDRKCFIGATTIERRELARRYEIGVGNLLWGNDFPHPEGTWPNTAEWLRTSFHDIPIGETAAILGTNAAEVHGFDVDALRPLVERIGPTPADLGQHEPSSVARWGRRGGPALVDRSRPRRRHLLSGWRGAAWVERCLVERCRLVGPAGW